MEDGYIHYLMGLVNVGDDYEKLCKTLYKIPFDIDNRFITDTNRGHDGLSLRSLYLEDSKEHASVFRKKPCSVLEMMIALSMRIETDIMGFPGRDDPGRWFIEMLGNLGLDGMLNRYFDEEEVVYAVNTWLKRNYNFNGEGSLFPLRKYKYDQRNLAIWDQMSIYLTENY